MFALAVWAFNVIFIDGKMRGLFSFLFGASMLLVIERATAKGESPAKVHFSRMFWLFLFGEAHLILLWWGDILNHYALVGCIAWFFRKPEAHKLVAIAIMLIVAELWMVGGMAYDAHNAVAAMQVPHPRAAAISTDSPSAVAWMNAPGGNATGTEPIVIVTGWGSHSASGP